MTAIAFPFSEGQVISILNNNSISEFSIKDRILTIRTDTREYTHQLQNIDSLKRILDRFMEKVFGDDGGQ